MIKHAFLIIAHNNWWQLKKLMLFSFHCSVPLIRFELVFIDLDLLPALADAYQPGVLGALRSEVKKAKDSAGDYRRRLDRLKAEYDYMVSLWGEFDCDLLRIADVELSVQKIAGVRTPVLQDVKFEVKPYDLFSSPVWFADGVDILKRMAQLGIEFEVYNRKMELLDYARRKTTQKVNLYEKVQIPGYEDAIRKIKRFMEDEENLSKSAQKIVKTKQQQAGEGATL